MKFLSGLFKLIASFLVLTLVIFLPLTLLVQGVGSLLLSPTKMVELLEENIIDVEVVASFAENEVDRREFRPEQNNPFISIAVAGLKNLDHDQWIELTQLIAPPELINETIEDVLVDYYRWVDSSNETPRASIDLEVWKSNLITNFVPALEMVFSVLPDCTAAQQRQFFNAGNLAEGAPACRPAEPVYGLLIEQVGTTFPALIQDMPDEYSLVEDVPEENVDWISLKKNLRTLALITQASWVVVLIIFVIAIPLGARSLSGVFTWTGWPVLLAGIGTLILAVLLLSFSRGSFPKINPIVGVVEKSPSVLSLPIGKLIGESLRFITRPLLFEAGAMILFGGVMVVIGIVVHQKSKPYEGIVAATTPELSPAPTGDPAETLEFSDEQLNQSPGDDERPSGMFG